MIINAVLRFFGLMTINQARMINKETIALFHRSIAQYAKEDFGVEPSDTEETSRQWADECFDVLIKQDDRGDVSLVGVWELPDENDNKQ